MTVGQRVLYLIEKQGRKRSDLANHLGTSNSTINGWKEENRSPSATYILPICEFLGVTPEFLLSGKDAVKSDFSLSAPEKKLISSYRQLPTNLQERLFGYAGGMLEAYLTSQEEEMDASSISKIS